MTNLEQMKITIESMSKINQIEILKILVNHNVKINENKSGIFVNMTFLDEKIIDDIKLHLEYVNKQEQNLEQIENQKEVFKTTFFE
tara:strand:+ start:3672 stop:3929 length:258 start_codon:yes stop_codon:yes gene_type:complete